MVPAARAAAMATARSRASGSDMAVGRITGRRLLERCDRLYNTRSQMSVTLALPAWRLAVVLARSTAVPKLEPTGTGITMGTAAVQVSRPAMGGEGNAERLCSSRSRLASPMGPLAAPGRTMRGVLIGRGEQARTPFLVRSRG